MAELTNLETKLGEVIGLAMAAQAATERGRGDHAIRGAMSPGVFPRRAIDGAQPAIAVYHRLTSATPYLVRPAG